MWWWQTVGSLQKHEDKGQYVCCHNKENYMWCNTDLVTKTCKRCTTRHEVHCTVFASNVGQANDVSADNA